MAKKDKLRGFVFFTQDYFGDVAVRLMPGYLRIVWVEAFLLMDQSPRRGVLLKKNGEPYTVEELAEVMNVPVEHVLEAHNWILREGIANLDGRTKSLSNRRMIREENRRKINKKNGQKGGNPSLLTKAKRNNLLDSVNRNPNRPDKAKPDPDPDPELIRLIKDDSSPEHTAATKPPPHPRDLASDFFSAKCLERTGTPYVTETADFVMLSKLRNAFHIEPRARPPGWEEAVEHYFASPLAQYSLADLANPKRYAVFKNSSLDEFNKPTNRRNGNAQRTFETKGEQLIRKQREQDERLHQALHGTASDGPGSGDSSRKESPVHPRLIGSD